MSTVRHQTYGPRAEPLAHSSVAPDSAEKAIPRLDQVRHYVDRAASGDIRMDPAPHRAVASDQQAPAQQGRLPAAWYMEPAQAVAAKTTRPEVIAASLGLAAGLMLLIPLAIWWQMGSSPSPQQFSHVTAQRSHERVSAQNSVDVVAVRTVSITPERDAVEVDTRDVDAIADAQALLATGDVIGARERLSALSLARDAEALFLLAETYDPNVLAARGVRGVGADTERARGLYAAARRLGHQRAALRLSALR